MDLPYVHEVVVELEAGGDAGALGGAVTVACAVIGTTNRRVAGLTAPSQSTAMG